MAYILNSTNININDIKGVPPYGELHMHFKHTKNIFVNKFNYGGFALDDIENATLNAINCGGIYIENSKGLLLRNICYQDIERSYLHIEKSSNISIYFLDFRNGCIIMEGVSKISMKNSRVSGSLMISGDAYEGNDHVLHDSSDNIFIENTIIYGDLCIDRTRNMKILNTSLQSHWDPFFCSLYESCERYHSE